MAGISRTPRDGFTIIELLVVVSIIALLVGILLPAIGRAREQAQLTRSQANIKQMGTAAVTYAGEWGERQVTWIDDNISTYGVNNLSAFNSYNNTNGTPHPWMILGWSRTADGSSTGTTWYITSAPVGIGGFLYEPIAFVDYPGVPGSKGYGAFRMINTRAFAQYVGGRFFDPVFFAPKDVAAYAAAEKYFENPDEYVPHIDTLGDLMFPSYCMSPAAMLNPQVLSKVGSGNSYFTNPWSLAGGFRSPTPAQASYSNLKTQFLEHNWCQNRKKTCNPGWAGGPYDNCTPYYYNAALDSQPVAQFYDGHIEGVGVTTAIDANARIVKQTGHGLWSLSTTLGPGGTSYGNPSGHGLDGGYFMGVAFDSASTCFHTLTIDGIKGRDVVDR